MKSFANVRGFALVSTLMFLPLALIVLVFSIQLLFFNKVKNGLLENCFLYSVENVERNVNSFTSTAELNDFLEKSFRELNRLAPINFFVIDLKFAPIQKSNSGVKEDFVELATELQFSITSQNTYFKGFRQNFKCGAFLKWKDSKKLYGIIAAKY